MTRAEYLVQHLRTHAQWSVGSAGDRVRVRSKGEKAWLELLGVPALASWATKESCDHPCDLEHAATAPCGTLMLVTRDGDLFSWDGTHGLQLRADLREAVGDEASFTGARIGYGPGVLWLLLPGDRDSGSSAGSRAVLLDRSTYQVLRTLDPLAPGACLGGLDGAVDLAVTEEHAWILDGRRLHRARHESGTLGSRLGYGSLADPRALAVEAEETFAWVADRAEPQLIRVDLTNTEHERRVDLDDIAEGFRPDRIALLPNGELLLATSDPNAAGGGFVYVVTTAGRRVGRVPLPSTSDGDTARVIAIVPLENGFALATSAGISLHDDGKTADGVRGRYLVRTLDSGALAGERWHRIELEADLPVGSQLAIRYASSDGLTDGQADELRDGVDAALGSGGDVHALEKADRLLDGRWSEPEVFSGPVAGRTLRFLLRRDTGRYLWFQLQLQASSAAGVPTVSAVRVVHPRKTYLEYLPAVFAETPGMAVFLERFLSIFETVLGGLDRDLDQLGRSFDPRAVPEERLSWLASWLGVDVEHGWDVDRRRRVVTNLRRFVRGRGTPRALRALVKLVLGGSVQLLESPGADRAVVLGGDRRLGIGTALARAHRRSVALGSNAVLGRDRLLQGSVDPGRVVAGGGAPELVVEVEPTSYEDVRRTVGQLLRAHAPAHVRPKLTFVRHDGARLGTARVGIDFRLAVPSEARVGTNTIGRGTPAASKKRPQLGRSRLDGEGPRLT